VARGCGGAGGVLKRSAGVVPALHGVGCGERDQWIMSGAEAGLDRDVDDFGQALGQPRAIGGVAERDQDQQVALVGAVSQQRVQTEAVEFLAQAPR